MTNVNTNIDDKLFYFYGVKPLEKEFQNFEKRVCTYLVETHGFTKAEAFIAWQMYKINIKLLHSPAVAVREAAEGGENGGAAYIGIPQLDVKTIMEASDNNVSSLSK